MAKITYSGNERNRSLIKRMSIKRDETIDINPIHALTYLGDDDFKITFENSDKEELKKCSKGQEKVLTAEFGCNSLDEVLEKMYPKPKTPVFTPKKKIETKKEATKKPTVKPKTVKKKVVTPQTIKKDITVGEG